MDHAKRCTRRPFPVPRVPELVSLFYPLLVGLSGKSDWPLFLLNLGFSSSHLSPCSTDDGISPERAAQVMGPPDRCQHAAHVISELILTAQVGLALGAAPRSRHSSPVTFLGTSSPSRTTASGLRRLFLSCLLFFLLLVYHYSPFITLGSRCSLHVNWLFS